MFGGISIWQLLIILVIVIMIFGTKKLRSLGGDLGGAVKGFKKAMNDGEKEQEKSEEEKTAEAMKSIEGKADAEFDQTSDVKQKDQDKA